MNKLRFVIAGSKDLMEITQSDNPDISPYNIGQDICLKDFTKDQCDLFRKAWESLGLQDGEKIRNLIYEKTCGHPCLTQWMYHHAAIKLLYDDKSKDIKDLIEYTLTEEMEKNFKNIWSLRKAIKDGIKNDWFRYVERVYLGDKTIPFTKSESGIYIMFLKGFINSNFDKCLPRNSIYTKIVMSEIVKLNKLWKKLNKLKKKYPREFELIQTYKKNGKQTIITLPEGIEAGKKDSNFGWDVFISYSSKDFNIIQQIISDFKKSKISYWLDKEQVEPGHFIIKQIEKGLKESRYILCCFSKNQIESGWSRVEYEAVLFNIFSNEKSAQRVIPLIIDDLKYNELPVFIWSIDKVHFQDIESYKKLLEFFMRIQGNKFV